MNRIMTLCAVFLLTCLSGGTAVFAQSGYEVKGVVVDAVGPVIGATVIELGTTNGTATGLDGDYSLTVSNADAIVEISCIGYATQTFIAQQLPKTVTLAEDQLFLDDVVVIGYGSVKKEDMTGSVVAIEAEAINRGAVTSPSAMLVGKVSGLNITPATGKPGEGATIRIRGAASLSASNDPLIVIDGVPVTREGGAGMGDPLATVNPNDIESYSVLKDASATAIYGSRASNGVIIITTKKGKGKGVQVSYNGSASVKTNAKTINVMSGPEFAAFIQEYRPAAAALLGYNGQIYDTDWQKEIYRPALNTDHNISVYSGDVIPMRVSWGYNLDQATIKKGSNQRTNIDISISPKLFDEHLSINFNTKVVYQSTLWGSNAVGAALAFDPTKPVYFTDANGNIDRSQVSNGYWNWLFSDGSANTMASTNPLSSVYDWEDRGKTIRGLGNLQLDYKIHGLESLRVNLNLGLDIAKTTGFNYNQLGTIGSKRSAPDTYSQYNNFNRNSLLEFYVDYNETFGKKHNLNAMAGYSWQHNYVVNGKSEWYNNDRDELIKLTPDYAKEYYLVSFFGRLNYSYDSRYLFTFTARGDASSRFAPNNRWGFFPSAAFAWNVANEGFLKGNKVVSQLKFRLGWGRTGQQDLGDNYYPYLALYEAPPTVSMTYPMGPNGESYSTLSPLAYNPSIRWETTETSNIGLDFGFLKDRITGSVEAYYRHTYDLLNDISIPLGSNFGKTVVSNIGEMVNKGVEISANFIPVETTDWHWEIGGNFTFQDVKITKLTNDDANYPGVQTGKSMLANEGYSSLHYAGYAPWTYYLYEQLYDSDGNPIQNAFVDRDGDGQITSSDRYLTGCSSTPWAYYGFHTQLRWKNWDFGINGHGSIGAELLNKTAMGYSTYASDDSSKGYINNLSPAWLIPGWSDANLNEQRQSDLWIENATFFKIDDINLGYTFNLKNDLKIRLAGSVQNVCTFTKYSGLDPELGSGDGVDDTIYPRPRMYTLRLNITF